MAPQTLNPDTLGTLVTRRSRSQFAADIAARESDLRAVVEGKRVLVVGGAGTIGAATTGLLADLRPASLHVVDQSENYLAELVRELRGRPQGLQVADFRTLPLDYGSAVMGRFLADAAPYDLVLNFAALKHVRSEKDTYSLLQMLDTNIVKHVRFKRWLHKFGHSGRYFAVSTDKAANPTSLMGASKRLMEDVAFDVAAGGGGVTSARFANVAFSNGSLLQGFLARLEKLQPLAVPRDTRRYFVSQHESGEICLLAALLGEPGCVYFPLLDSRTELQTLESVAERVLGMAGYRAEIFADETEARNALPELSRQGAWPLLLTPLDTSGEKPYEEFVGDDERAVATGFKSLGALRHGGASSGLSEVIERLDRAIHHVEDRIDKETIVALVKTLIPTFAHRETGKSLDDRL